MYIIFNNRNPHPHRIETCAAHASKHFHRSTNSRTRKLFNTTLAARPSPKNKTDKKLPMHKKKTFY